MQDFPHFPEPLDLEDLLAPFQHLGVNLGLDRIKTLLAALNNPHERVPFVHVGGSNGKGSLCTYLASILKAAGYRVGCYTSPHLVSWCERLQINGVPIRGTELRSLLIDVIAAIPAEMPTPTVFEVVTAAAWLYFARSGVDIAVMEVGLGGRLDATNVSDRPLATVITSISREHWQVLGSTLGAIAGEKAGILKADRPAVLGTLGLEARAVIQARLDQLACPHTWVTPAQPVAAPDPSALSIPDYLWDHPGWQWLGLGGNVYGVTLPGPAQRLNVALALETCEVLRRQGWNIRPEDEVTGLAVAQWPGRLQWVQWQHQPLLVDGAHNPESAEMLRAYLDELDQQGRSSPADVHQSTTWIMGMLSTKDHREIFQTLLRPGDRLYLVPVPDHSSADPHSLSLLAQTLVPDLDQCIAYPNLFSALGQLHTPGSLPGDRPGILSPKQGSLPQRRVLCGSLYLIGYFFCHGRSLLEG